MTTTPEEVLFAEFDLLRARFQENDAVKHISNLCDGHPSYEIRTGYGSIPYVIFAIPFCIANERRKAESKEGYVFEGYSRIVIWSITLSLSKRFKRFKQGVQRYSSSPRIQLGASLFIEKIPFNGAWGTRDKVEVREIIRFPRTDYASVEHTKSFVPNIALASEAVMTDMLSFRSLEELLALHSEAFTAENSDSVPKIS